MLKLRVNAILQLGCDRRLDILKSPTTITQIWITLLYHWMRYLPLLQRILRPPDDLLMLTYFQCVLVSPQIPEPRAVCHCKHLWHYNQADIWFYPQDNCIELKKIKNKHGNKFNNIANPTVLLPLNGVYTKSHPLCCHWHHCPPYGVVFDHLYSSYLCHSQIPPNTVLCLPIYFQWQCVVASNHPYRPHRFPHREPIVWQHIQSDYVRPSHAMLCGHRNLLHWHCSPALLRR